MNPLQAFTASLARSRAQAHAALYGSQSAPCRSAAALRDESPGAAGLLQTAGHGVEHITIEPPIWCHDCNRIVSGMGYMVPGAAQISVLCPACAAKRYPDRRHPGGRRVRQLVEVTRLLAWQAQDSATDHANRGCHETARVLRELAAAADSAIEALRTYPQEV
jgi:hypothetical protein